MIHQEPASFPDLTVTGRLLGQAGNSAAFAGSTRHPCTTAPASCSQKYCGIDLNRTVPPRACPSRTADLRRSPRPSRWTLDLLVIDEPTTALGEVEVRRLFAVAPGLHDAAAPSSSSRSAWTEWPTYATPSRLIADEQHRSRPDAVADVTPDELVRPHGQQTEWPISPPRCRARRRGGAPGSRGSIRPSTCTTCPSTSKRARSVGLAGLVGAGPPGGSPARWSDSSTGPDAGRVAFEPADAAARRTAAAIATGLALVPEDRRLRALVTESSVGRDVSSVVTPTTTRPEGRGRRPRRRARRPCAT